MSRHRSAALLLALGLLVGGCAGTDAAEPTSTPTPSSSSSSSSSSSEPSQESDPTTTAPAEPAGTQLTVQVAGGQVSGDTGRVPVPLGDRVTVTITSDAPDEAHLHGYDVTADLVPGTPAELVVDATIPGVFELELHELGTVLLTLQVS